VTNPGHFPGSEPPSAARLFRSTAIAAVVAAVILVTIVLPAEYGVDPSGIGRRLGLKEMGEIKTRLAKEESTHSAEQAAADSGGTAAQQVATNPAATPVQSATEAGAKSEVTDLVLLPSQGKEIKLAMNRNARVTYVWSVNRGVVNYDTHADSPTIKYQSYAKGTAVKADSGLIVAAFDGHHGWFWRNRSSDTVTITLRVTGDYQQLKHMP